MVTQVPMLFPKQTDRLSFWNLSLLYVPYKQMETSAASCKGNEWFTEIRCAEWEALVHEKATCKRALPGLEKHRNEMTSHCWISWLMYCTHTKGRDTKSYLTVILYLCITFSPFNRALKYYLSSLTTLAHRAILFSELFIMIWKSPSLTIN